jgi:tRNA-splicing ligase RtcB
MNEVRDKFKYQETEGKPLKLWDSAGEFEEAAMTQLHNVASLPFIYSHVAGMPDVHAGYGATVGSVIATKGAVIPSAVGVDIGCGMVAVKTSLSALDFPDSLKKIRYDIEAAVPHGRTKSGRSGDKGAWSKVPRIVEDEFRCSSLSIRLSKILVKHPKVLNKNYMKQLGTLGTGNHFIEVCLDEYEDVWVMIHSGSRGIGNSIGSYFITKAKEEMEKYFITSLKDKDLAYLVEYSELYDDYMEAVSWAQDYARMNRDIMMQNVLQVLKKHFPTMTIKEDKAINCHHNYVEKENHFGSNVLVTRKGAVRARKGDYGIIPGSMGTGSFIVEGKGNSQSFCSCSHGAGRVMSRTKARKTISLEEHIKAVEGVECRTDMDILDESPAAYKDIGKVMEAQTDLVDIKYRLRQIINVKG